MSTLHVENLKGLSSGGNANKIIVPSGQTIDASAGTLVPSAGAVVQVKQTKWYSSQDTNNTSFTSVDASQLDITPKYSNSSFYINYNAHIYCREGELHGLKPYFYVASTGSWSSLTSNSTFHEISRVANSGTGAVHWGHETFDFFVGMIGNGTEQISFKLYHKSYSGNSLRINDNGGGSSITVMEIKE